MPDPIEPEKQANTVTPATVWQSPDSAPPTEHGRFYKVGLIAGGVLIFLALAVLLAFI